MFSLITITWCSLIFPLQTQSCQKGHRMLLLHTLHLIKGKMCCFSLIVGRNISFALCESGKLEMRPYPFTSPPSRSLDLWPMLRIDWHSCHSVSGKAFRTHFEPISNPAGHQLGSTSIIQLAIPDPPFPIDDSLPQGDHIGPVHLSSSGAIGVEAFLTPEGPQPLLMSHSLPLTFPERSMHILINHTLRSTWWLAEWHPITMKHFVFSMTMKSGNGAQAADSTLNNDSFRGAMVHWSVSRASPVYFPGIGQGETRLKWQSEVS